jgi:hypothetical protein
MKKNVVGSAVSERECRARRAALAIVIALACLGTAACAGERYVRDWTFNGVDLTDTLFVGEDSFSLERVSDDGIELFSGRFEAGTGTWRFEIETWKAADGEERHFDPPVVFVCRARLFENGIAFFSGRFVGRAPITVFLHTPTDFDRQD